MPGIEGAGRLPVPGKVGTGADPVPGKEGTGTEELPGVSTAALVLEGSSGETSVVSPAGTEEAGCSGVP